MAGHAPLVWDDLRVVLAVARRGSHGGAARLLAVDPTTIGRRLTAAERALGTRLFDRTPGGLVATEAGAALLARAERVEAELLAAERELSGRDAALTGTVRVTAGDGMIHHVLVPRLGELRRAHPGITIELRADTRTLDLSRREADIAVRIPRPTSPELVALRFGAMGFGLYASPRYLERHGAPRRAADLAGHDLIGFEAELDGAPQVRWLRRTVRTPRWAIRASTTTAQLGACAEGLGLALLPTFVARTHPTLIAVLPALRPPPRETWLVVHRDLRRNARVAAVLAWLQRVDVLR